MKQTMQTMQKVFSNRALLSNEIYEGQPVINLVDSDNVNDASDAVNDNPPENVIVVEDTDRVVAKIH